MSLHRLMYTGFSEARAWHSDGLGDGGWYGAWTIILGWPRPPAFLVLIWASLSLHFCTGWQGWTLTLH